MRKSAKETRLIPAGGLWARAIIAVGLVGGCSDHMVDHESMNIPEVIGLPAWDGTFDGIVAPDLAPADDVVEVQLEAKQAKAELAQGRRVQLWTYNDVLPGSPIGNTVRIRFKDSVPEGTTIHWHGLRVPNSVDGVHLVQTPIAPGAEFTYVFVVPDAGACWYHPHIRSDEQMFHCHILEHAERGMAGELAVAP